VAPHPAAPRQTAPQPYRTMPNGAAHLPLGSPSESSSDSSRAGRCTRLYRATVAGAALLEQTCLPFCLLVRVDVSGLPRHPPWRRTLPRHPS
jgi:hypothetical protein